VAIAATAVGVASLGYPGEKVSRRVPGIANRPELEPLTTSWLPATVTYWRSDIEGLAAEHRIDPNLLAIVVLVESGGHPGARSRTGALGLAQIVPATGRHIAAERGLAGHSDARLLEARHNLDFGAWYLGRQLARFGVADPDQSVDLVAAAYNGGPTRLGRHLARAAELSAETRRYVGWVGGMWRERHGARSETYAAWWAAGGERLVGAAALELGLFQPAAPE
jgi:hypothetical protein